MLHKTPRMCAQTITTTFAPGEAAVYPTVWYSLSRSIHSPTNGDSQFTAAITPRDHRGCITSRGSYALNATRSLPLRRTCAWKLSVVVHNSIIRPHHRLTQRRHGALAEAVLCCTQRTDIILQLYPKRFHSHIWAANQQCISAVAILA